MDNMNTKKICLRCAAELDADATFCTRCGERCAPAPSQPAAPQAATVTQPVPTPPASPVPPASPAPQAVPQHSSVPQPRSNGIKSAFKKIDVKHTILSNVIPVICLAVGMILVFVGLGTSIPSNYISSYGMTEYVGGDAYNFIIEAGLRGGRIAGAIASKSLYIAVGLLIACTAAMKINLVCSNPDTK